MPEEQPVISTAFEGSDMGAAYVFVTLRWHAGARCRIRPGTRSSMVGRPMRAVTFQAPGEVLVQEVPEPELQHPEDALVRVEASGICGSDLHIYHGRTPVERGFTIGHEFVGTVLAVGDAVERAAVGDRVLGCFHTACGTCVACVRGDYHRCLVGRTF